MPDADELGPDLRALLESERQRGLPEAARLRLHERLDAATGGALSGGGGGAGGGGGGARAPRGGGTTSAAGVGGAAARRLLFGLSTFAAGTVTGVVGHALLTERPEPVAVNVAAPTRESPPPAVPVVARAPAPAPTPPAAAAVAVAEPAPPTAPAAAPPERRARAAPLPASVAVAAAVPADTGGDHDTDLAAERAVLDIAHTAVARGDTRATLDALTRHARRFASGRMEEERESLYVQALVQAGRYGDARDRAIRFQRRFPNSLLRPAVDAALAAIP